jgi:uncharacterized protein YjbI with pentapeptide repeats
MAGHQNHTKFNSNMQANAPETESRGFWRWTGFADKTLWNILELLVLPLSLIVGAWYLNGRLTQQQQVLQSQADEQQRVAQQTIAESQQDILDRYIEEIISEIETGLLDTDPDAQRREIARARTLLTLRSLDEERKMLLLQFIYEAGLINDSDTVISLQRANLSNLDLDRAFFAQANLQETILSNSGLAGAKLQGANFSVAELSQVALGDAFLFEANLNRANLSRADLNQAILVRANLSGADLNNANLQGAFLVRANLRGANLRDANLRNANLNEANLSSANLDGADLSQAFLCETIMPDGTPENRDCL